MATRLLLIGAGVSLGALSLIVGYSIVSEGLFMTFKIGLAAVITLAGLIIGANLIFCPTVFADLFKTTRATLALAKKNDDD